MAIDGKTFRDSMGRFPIGVVIATVRDKEGHRWGFTASAFSSLSMKPPMILVCLDTKADCHHAFLTADYFGVNILRPQHQSTALRFSSKGVDKFAEANFITGKHGVPLLSDALVALECRMDVMLRGGDHTILTGIIENATVQDGTAMVYMGGKFFQLPPV